MKKLLQHRLLTMTGNKAFSCLFCRVLRVIELNRRLTHINHLRLRYSSVAGCSSTKRYFTTSLWLQDQTTDSKDGSESSSSDSSSSDSDGSDLLSSESDSDSDTQVQKAKLNEKPRKAEAGSFGNLLAMMKASESKWGSKENAEDKLKDIEHSIDLSLVKEASKLSKELPGDPVKSESDLIGQLLSQFETTANQRKGAEPNKEETVDRALDLSSLVEGLSVERVYKKHGEKNKRDDDFHFRDVEKDDLKNMFRKSGSDILNGEPLGIFKPEDMKSEEKSEKKSLFDVVAEEEREQFEFYPPKNAFEEQIQWTKEGKLWTFPIDNEAGWEEEQNVDFYQHMFLEDQIEDFPKQGPIRHFIELVLVGLSKNPYLTIEQKHETIDWYRNYFKEKQDLLEAGLGKDGVIQAKA